MEKKKQLEEELEEVNLFLARPDVRNFRVIDEEGFPSKDTEMVCQVRSAKNRQAGLFGSLFARSYTACVPQKHHKERSLQC